MTPAWTVLGNLRRPQDAAVSSAGNSKLRTPIRAGHCLGCEVTAYSTGQQRSSNNQLGRRHGAAVSVTTLSRSLCGPTRGSPVAAAPCAARVELLQPNTQLTGIPLARTGAFSPCSVTISTAINVPKSSNGSYFRTAAAEETPGPAMADLVSQAPPINKSDENARHMGSILPA